MVTDKEIVELLDFVRSIPNLPSLARTVVEKTWDYIDGEISEDDVYAVAQTAAYARKALREDANFAYQERRENNREELLRQAAAIKSAESAARAAVGRFRLNINRSKRAAVEAGAKE